MRISFIPVGHSIAWLEVPGRVFERERDFKTLAENDVKRF
jgi:hypothetical protein